jgi:chemotaxis protein methyltransferase CheR
VTDLATDRFARAVSELLGFQCDPSRREFYARVLERRAGAHRTSAERYVDQLGHLGQAEVDALAAEITVSETYFFRHKEQLQLVVGWAEQAGRPLRILSAGCSSGEEPYSLAMLLHAYSPEITAVDVNRVALRKAAAGRYTAWSFRETSRSLQERWFRRSGDEWILDPAIVRSVRFLRGNLVEDGPTPFWLPGYYDVILCRNVIMYFSLEVAETVVQRMQQSLAPEGHLLLGHAETLHGVKSELQLRHLGHTFAYENNAEWVTEIARRSQRIEALTTLQPPPPVVDLGPAEELLRQERFADALAVLENAPAGHPQVELLRTALLTHSGKWQEAETACTRLLHSSPDDPGPRYLVALCREGLGDLRSALRHYQMAATADAEFAMPRLRMGLLYRRLGQSAEAQRELKTASTLLGREQDKRLLLFGGGFSRQALLALCRAELKAVEHA